MVQSHGARHAQGMVRIVLLAWVLFSIPLCIALGHMFRSASTKRRDGFDPGEVANMLKRGGFHKFG